jgi:two-component system response regulator
MRGSILVADDDPVYAGFLRSAFARAMPTTPMIHVEDGEEAIQILSDSQGAGQKSHLSPGALLLDLQMPKKDGLEVLEWINGQRNLKDLPVIVISGSQGTPAVARAYELGAKGCLTKPCGRAGLKQLAELLKLWLNSPELPVLRDKPTFL